MFSRREPTQPQKVRKNMRTPTINSSIAGSTARHARAVSKGMRRAEGGGGIGKKSGKFYTTFLVCLELWCKCWDKSNNINNNKLKNKTQTNQIFTVTPQCLIDGGCFTCVLGDAGVHSDRHHHQGDELRRRWKKKNKVPPEHSFDVWCCTSSQATETAYSHVYVETCSGSGVVHQKMCLSQLWERLTTQRYELLFKNIVDYIRFN